MVLREVPIADSVDAMPEPPRVIMLGLSEQDAPTIPSISMSLNQPMKQLIMNQNQRPPLHLKPLQHLPNRRGHLWLVAVKEREACKTSS